MKYELLLLLPNAQSHVIEIDADHVVRAGDLLSFYSLDRDSECNLVPAHKGAMFIDNKNAYETTAIRIGDGTSYVLNIIGDNAGPSIMAPENKERRPD